MPRLGPFIDFLLTNPHIKVHVRNKNIVLNFFGTLGIEESRLVSGNVHAKLLYLPPGGGCGWYRPLSGLALTMQYQNNIMSTHSSSALQHNVIILIRRSSRRWLAQHGVIAAFLQEAAKQHNMTLWIFNDRPLPPFSSTMAMFYRARLIVAPHGAGLSNVMFTSPGAAVIEVLCNFQPNGCYYNTVQTLGHAYIGLLAKPGKCGPMSVDMDYFKQVTNTVLMEIMKERNSK